MPNNPTNLPTSSSPLWPVALAIQVRRTAVMRYGMALVFTALAFLVTVHLGPGAVGGTASHVDQDQFVYFVVAVMFASWFGGLGPGLLTTILSTLIINFVLLPPPFRVDFNSNDLPRLGVFITVCLMVNWLEESRVRTEARMRQSEEHFRSLIEGVQDYAIFMLDPKGNVLTWNNSAERVTGYSEDAIVGQPYARMFLPEDVQAGRPARLLAKAAEHGRAEEEHWRVRRDGSRYCAGTVISALRDHKKALRGFSIITRDLTEQKDAEELSRHRQNEIAHISRLTTMNELATGIAHEINQPLSAIAIYSHGCLERLKDVPGVPPDVLEAMRDIAAQAQRAGEIISHFRKLVRKREPERAAADLNALVKQAADLLHADATRQGVTLEVNLASGLTQVICDSVQIEQVVINLIKNAVEAITDDHSEVRVVRVTTEQTDPTRVTVRVCDTGPGLSSADIDCAFEPFFTTKANGLGMGLNISHSIIESHGGRLTATPNPDRGVTFSFTIPISPTSGKDADNSPIDPNDSSMLTEAIVTPVASKAVIDLPPLSPTDGESCGDQPASTANQDEPAPVEKDRGLSDGAPEQSDLPELPASSESPATEVHQAVADESHRPSDTSAG
jgi:two-component system sensor kinase FixL